MDCFFDEQTWEVYENKAHYKLLMTNKPKLFAQPARSPCDTPKGENALLTHLNSPALDATG